jgi:hypothetical protein
LQQFVILDRWAFFVVKGEGNVAEINKLSVEKALEKLRGGDTSQSKNARFNEKMDALDEETKRMRAQRLRLERHQRKPDQGDH